MAPHKGPVCAFILVFDTYVSVIGLLGYRICYNFIQTPVRQQGDMLRVRLDQLAYLFVCFVSIGRIPSIPSMP